MSASGRWARSRFGIAKGAALREHQAQAYVGDHLADVAAARAAGILAVSVASGSSSPEALRHAGAEVVLPDLRAFPPWLEERLNERTAACDR